MDGEQRSQTEHPGWDGRRRAYAWLLLATLVAATGASAGLALGTGNGAGTASAGPSLTGPAVTPSQSALALQRSYIAVVDELRPSVVEISTSTGLGSGIVYDDAGDIVTNDHVVAGSTSFTVSASNGKQFRASLVGRFAPDDLAVIKVPSGSGLKPATFGNSANLEVGQLVLAIGNPLGLESSVTNGIVSAVGRTVSEGGGVTLPQTVQTSAPINPGNSGGALVDIQGEVIGIPTLAATDPQLGGSAAPGIGFAIPSNTVKLIADQLVQQGKVTKSGRAALGISATTVYDPAGSPAGVGVVSVEAGGPADSAGLVQGDVITRVAGQQTPDVSAMADVLAGLAPGKTVTVDYVGRDGASRSAQVTLGELQG